MSRKKDSFIFKSRSPEETMRFGKAIGASIEPPAFLGLSGPLGTGKTLLAKAIASGLGHDPHEVHSPTFTLMNIYEGAKRLYHFDFYRLDSSKDFEGLGLEEFFDEPDTIILVEWVEKVKEMIPDKALMIYLEFGAKANERKIKLQATGSRMKKYLKEITDASR